MIDLLSAVHDGRPPFTARGSGRWFVPDGFITKRRHAGPATRRNAMCLPFGDQAGKLSRAPEVSLRSPLPSRFMTKIPTPRRTKTTRVPSGENAGSVAIFA